MAGMAADILRLLYCPHCRYDLRSLPAIHTCPECGFVYDETIFSLPARELDEFAAPLTRLHWRRSWTWFLRIVFYVAVPAAIFLTAFWRGAASIFYFQAFAGLSFLGFLIAAMKLQEIHSRNKRKQTGADEERSLYCLDPEGFLIPREGTTPQRWKWRHFDHASAKKFLRYEEAGVYHWQIRLHRPKRYQLLLINSIVLWMRGDANQAEQAVTRINALIKSARARANE